MKTFRILLSVIVLFTGIASFPYMGHAVSARGAILMEQESGRVLFEKNAHTPMRIASITKIMTAILAIESGKLDEYVTVSEKAYRTEGSSIYIQPGDKIKLIDLTYGLMLRSGNDAAVAIAEHVGGDLENFVTLMNKKAKQIGMKNTTFANPHGLDDHENHYSTAYDMALLTRYAMNNKDYAKISSTKSYTCKSLDRAMNTWLNKNKLLNMYPYSTGGKTGYTKRAKRTLVSTAEKEKLKLIAVTINDRNDWQDHMALFNQAFNQYEAVKIIDKEKQINYLSVIFGKVVPKRDIIYPLKKGERQEISISISVDSDLKEREDFKKPIGKVKISLKDELIGESPLILVEPFETSEKEDKDWWEKIKSKLNIN
ncbi:D-alanyl-D-alanine carboxypeptidase family protein [Robertmurraya mangrovi]